MNAEIAGNLVCLGTFSLLVGDSVSSLCIVCDFAFGFVFLHFNCVVLIIHYTSFHIP